MLTSVIRSYDDSHQISSFERCLQRQHQLPLKMRYKPEQLNAILTNLMWTGLNLYDTNAYFITLPSSIRSFLLEKTIPQVLGLNGIFILRTFQICDEYLCYEMIAKVYDRIIAKNYQIISQHLDTDGTFMKLVIAMLMFSPNEFPMDSLQSTLMIRKILKIQNMYIELLWRFMALKYDENRVVLSFSNLIRSLFAFQSSVQSITNLPTYQNVFNCLIEYTKTKLNIDKYFFD